MGFTVCTKSTPKLTQQLSNSGLPRQFCLAALRQEHKALASGTKEQFFKFNYLRKPVTAQVGVPLKMKKTEGHYCENFIKFTMPENRRSGIHKRLENHCFLQLETSKNNILKLSFLRKKISEENVSQCGKKSGLKRSE